MQAIKQYAKVEDGYLHIKLPDNFSEKDVEVIILAQDKRGEEASEMKPITPKKLYAHKVKIDNS
jgi:hypothetical protein